MRRVPFALAVALMLATAGTAGAAAVSWDNPSGTSPGSVFSWQDGQSGDGDLIPSHDLWGEPTVDDLAFHFNDMDSRFKAESLDAQNPQSDSITSTLSVRITGLNPYYITDVWVYEWGTFTGDLADVSATSFVTITPLDPLGIPPVQDQGSVIYNFNTGTGAWTAFKHVDMTALTGLMPGVFDSGAHDFALDVTNTLSVNPDLGETATIAKLGGRIVVPEPSTLLFGLCGLVAVSLRRLRGSSRTA